MSLHIFGIASNSLSALFALAAALLWHRSAVKVLDHPGGTGNPEMVVNGTLFVSTALAQSTWSRRAAYMAATAAFFQACGMVAAQAAA